VTTKRNFDPEHRVDMWQARCTNCGYIETDYGDHAAWSDADIPRTQVVENWDWFERWVIDSRENGKVESHLEELLCPDCQECEVCGGKHAYCANDDEHLVCEEHEDHDFSAVAS
jgi:hypothetical protein